MMNNATLVELHYHLRDGAHSMDAHVRNRCETEVLAYFEHVLKQLDVHATIETTVYVEGGLREVWRFLCKTEHAAAVGATAAVVMVPLGLLQLIVTCWALPAAPDKELDALNKEVATLSVEEKRLNIQLLKEALRRQTEEEAAGQSAPTPNLATPALPAPPANESSVVGPLPSAQAPIRARTIDRIAATPAGVDLTHSRMLVGRPGSWLPEISGVSAEVVRSVVVSFQSDTKLVARRSNFFKSLLTYDKVTAVGMRTMTTNAENLGDESTVQRDQFPKFVTLTDKLPVEVVDDAIIEIVAPVIKEGNVRWKGIYDEKSINFDMNDSAFKDLVFRRQVSFGSGDSIRCVLNIELKVDGLGDRAIVGYSVPVVISKIDSNGEQPTSRGRRHVFSAKQASTQSGLFENAPTNAERPEGWGDW